MPRLLFIYTVNGQQTQFLFLIVVQVRRGTPLNEWIEISTSGVTGRDLMQSSF
jgi:hypothetical protein